MKLKLIAAAAAAFIVLAAHQAHAQQAEDHEAMAAAHGAMAGDYDAHHAMVSGLLQQMLADTDFTALKTHLVQSAETYAADAGLEAEPMTDHIAMMVDHVAEMQREHPDMLSSEFASILMDIRIHAPDQ